MQQERKEISGKANTIAGFSIPLYLGILALVVVCMYMDCLPAGLVGGMIALMVLGFISGRGDEKRLPAYWAKYQQIHRMDNLLRANLVGVWLCAEARVAVYREGSGYRVQLGVLDEKTGAWENDEQDEVFPTLADVREYAAQEGYEPMDVDFEQMTDEEFQQFLDAHRI